MLIVKFINIPLIIFEALPWSPFVFRNVC